MRVRALQITTLLAIAAVGFAACAPPPAATTGTPADETAIRAIGTTYAEAWNKGDVAGMLALSTDDYEAVAPDGRVIKGRAALEAQMKEEAAGRAGLPLKLAVQTSMVRWTGATSAAVGGTWTLEGLPAGMGSGKGAWSSTMTKGADGAWKMATGLVAEFVPPPAPPAPAADPGKGK